MLERASRLDEWGNHGKPGPSSRTRGSTMTQKHRCLCCAGILIIGLAAQGELNRLNQTERPALRRDLASIPKELGDWVGEDEPVAPDIVERAQTTEYLNRVYESRKPAGLAAHALDQLLGEGNEPAAHARDLPSVRRLDQDRIADQGAQHVSPRTATKYGSLDWVTSKVNWLSTWDSGITFSVKASWRTLSGNCRSPAGAATDRPRVAPR